MGVMVCGNSRERRRYASMPLEVPGVHDLGKQAILILYVDKKRHRAICGAVLASWK